VELTERFDDAFKLASDLHHTQTRKSSEVPYLSHLMAVSGLVLENGGTEDEAIAGLLHDAVEDQGGQATLERIREAFGDVVAELVSALSDTDEIPKPPWRARKEEYLRRLETAPQKSSGSPRLTSSTTHGRLCATMRPLAKTCGIDSALRRLTRFGTTARSQTYSDDGSVVPWRQICPERSPIWSG
jgi:hypothetical protein